MSGTSGIASTINNKLRMSGLSSGLDTDSMIQSLMKVENARVDKVKQEKQLLEWERDDYRSITNVLRGFKDEYFDVLKTSTNFKSAGAFVAAQASSSDTNILGVTAGSGAAVGSYNVTVAAIAQMAAKTGAAGVSKGYTGLAGTNPVDMSKMKQGKSFNVSLDGVSQTITLDRDYTGFTAANFATALDGLMDGAFGANKINVTESGGVLTFTPATASSVVSVGDGTNTYLGTLGFADQQSNAVTSGSITDFSGGNFKISVNSGLAVSIDVAAAGDRDTLVSNINDALATAGLDTTVQAIADPNDAAKVKFLTLDTTDKVTFTAGSPSTNNLLAKMKIGNNSSINPMNGTIAYGANDIGKDFYINVDGVQHHIDLDYNYANDTDTDSNGDTLAQAIQAQLDAGGATGVTVGIAGGKISFSNPAGHQISVGKGDAGLKNELGFTSTQGSRVDLGSTLGNAALGTGFTFDGNGDLSFTINGVSISANSGDTLSSVMDKINASSAGVRIKYDSLNDRFSMESKTTGSTAAIDNTDDTGNFFAALKIDTTTEARGTNASVTIGTTAIERTTNKFTVDGVAYDLKATGASTVTIAGNPDALMGKIKDFVAKYNDVIGQINGKLTEDRNRDYAPLTDDQKTAMKDTDITLWEAKAKSGLLKSDPILQKIADNMRKSLSDPVSGADLSLYQIGITTSSNYKDKGKLVIDEDKLSQAIKDNPDKIAQLFTKESQYSYSDYTNRSSRYKEEGLAQRLSDILDDNIRVTRDANGKKGALLEKAGIEGDITEFSNLVENEIDQKDDQITTLLDQIATKEDAYYTKFASMESILNQMNSQSAWLSQQLGQSG